jgi:diaminopimelate epimerase
MRIFRAHGLGNDYLVYPGPLHPALVRAICDRHSGLGSDGLLEPLPDQNGIAAVRIHNPDGSIAEKSGNGLRIFAIWRVLKQGSPPEFDVQTDGGRVHCTVNTHTYPPIVTVQMGQARVGPPTPFEDQTYTPVSIGNPHAVVWGIPTDWQNKGARLEHAVPGRTNVQFIEIVDKHTINARIWERGAGHTLSSGSSACAIAAAAHTANQIESPVHIQMEGGTVRVHIGPHLALTLEGPVEPIAEMEIDPAWLSSRS